MISNDMYRILSHIPRAPKEISYGDLIAQTNMDKSIVWNILCEAFYDKKLDYINWRSEANRDMDKISLTESGVCAIEEYERMKANKEMMETSFKVAKIAMWAAIASAVAAIISLLR